jgi:hypothetical protein
MGSFVVVSNQGVRMPETLADKQRQAHARVTRQGVAATAAILQELFGQRLTAAIAGVKDAKAVGRWARGADVPREQAAAALENALQVIELLRTQEEDDTIRSWFRGMNPDLGDRPPALVIRSEPEHVIQAARAFLAQ